MAAAASKCFGSAILSLPEPIAWKPPIFLYFLRYSSVNGINLPSIKPFGPPKKPFNYEPGANYYNLSNKPVRTLWPPEA